MGTHRYRRLHFQVYRSQARKLACEALSNDPSAHAAGLITDCVRFEPIGQRAVEAFQLWGEQAHHFPWEDVPQWLEGDPKGFDLSLWFARELCGLCYASPRRSNRCIKIILLEGRPGPTHPLRGMVASLSLLAISEYAKILRYSHIEVQQPESGAEAVYGSLGFARDAAGGLVIRVRTNPAQIDNQILEVSMSYSTNSRKTEVVARLTAKAVALAGKTSDQQRHFLKVGLSLGRDLEPAGVLAGSPLKPGSLQPSQPSTI